MPNYFEQIQDYVEGRLAPAELLAFEQALSTDDALKAEVDLRKMIQDTLVHQQKVAESSDQLKVLLGSRREAFFATEQRATASNKRLLLRWGIGLAAAACIALILTFTGVLSPINYGSLPTMPEYAVRGNQTNGLYSQAVQAFNQGRYDDAIAQLLRLEQTEKSSATVRYYLGLSYLGKNDYQAAQPYLVKVASGQSIYNKDACYFLGYLFYQQEEGDKAKAYLQKVPEDSPYDAKASKLLGKIAP